MDIAPDVREAVVGAVIRNVLIGFAQLIWNLAEMSPQAILCELLFILVHPLAPSTISCHENWNDRSAAHKTPAGQGSSLPFPTGALRIHVSQLTSASVMAPISFFC